MEQIDKEPPPFHRTGHGRYQRNCDFISACHQLYPVRRPDLRGDVRKALEKSVGSWIWQRRLIWWDIWVSAHMYHFHQLPTTPAGQLVSWKSRVEWELEVGRVEWASEFLWYRVLKLRANETYEMGEKHTNRTRPVRKIILRIMHSLMFNRTKVARVVQSPKQALITSSSSEPAGPLLFFLSDGWNNVFYQMVVSDPCHS